MAGHNATVALITSSSFYWLRADLFHPPPDTTRSVRLAALAAALPLLAASRCSSFGEVTSFSLPPATQTGANTLGFVVEGQVWRDYGMSCSLTKSLCDSNQVRVDQYATNHAMYDLEAERTATGRNEYFTMTLLHLNGAGLWQYRFLELMLVPRKRPRWYGQGGW